MKDFLFRGSLTEVDPDVAELIEHEAERQARKLILIPSESTAPLAVRQAMGSVLQNLYAEGYPDPDTRWLSEQEILDYERQLAQYRRYADPRYYKGVEYADIIEALARRRCAEALATDKIGPNQIYVNVQPLSGAPANNAVYEALLKEGDTIMGMSLVAGGHLTHGSPVNRSGKHYNIVWYSVDPQTEKLDYDRILAQALEARPKIIIAGYTSYPYAPDWQKFREVANAVGAYLLADIAHVVGLVIAGAYPSPLGIADVISFTTHKTLGGPRGACLVTTNPELSRKIDRAVFPGEQGGPHVNIFAALSIAFKLARTEQFRELQHQTVRNAERLAQCLAENGIRVAYGGTNTHLLCIDCKGVQANDGTLLMGDIAARILDIAGIVANRNTLPGDPGAQLPSGVRMGTPWVTQRGFRQPEIDRLAKIIADLLQACTPYTYEERKGEAYRAKVDFDALEQAKHAVADLAAQAGIDFEYQRTGYPHFWFASDNPANGASAAGFDILGERATDFLQWATSNDVRALTSGQSQPTFLLEPTGQVMAPAVLRRTDKSYHLTIGASGAGRAAAWLRDLSDGYVAFDPNDRYAKLPGPTIVRDAGPAYSVELPSELSQASDLTKTFFIGEKALGSPAGARPLPSFTWVEPAVSGLKRTSLFETHKAMGARLVPFAGWEMPVQYSGVLDEHLAVRNAVGLFDVSHMGVFDVQGPNAQAFLDVVTTNDVSLIRLGQSEYSYLLLPDGSVIDDLQIYQLGPERYMVVVNASNNDKDWAWLNAVNNGEVRLDEARPWIRAPQAQLRDLRAPSTGKERRVDLALQGPNSLKVLQALAEGDPAMQKKLAGIKRTDLIQGTIGGFDLIVSRTGYTGESFGYELFVHPDRAPELWKKLLEIGQPFGIKPIGLAARDSLRTEAGLPLYGHELDGPMTISPGGAGFGHYVKLWKPFFVGREAYLAGEKKRTGEIVRFRMNEKGVRVPKSTDPIVNGRGQVIGYVTSCALDSEGYLLGQAYLSVEYTSPGTVIGIFPSPFRTEKPKSELQVGDRIQLADQATVVTRFPKKS